MEDRGETPEDWERALTALTWGTIPYLATVRQPDASTSEAATEMDRYLSVRAIVRAPQIQVSTSQKRNDSEMTGGPYSLALSRIDPVSTTSMHEKYSRNG